MHNQRLFWAMSLPMRYLGMTLDEWAVGAPLCVIGIVVLQGGEGIWGVSLITSGVLSCFFFKKWKKLSANFLLKSFLVGKGLLEAPAGHPNLVGLEAGR